MRVNIAAWWGREKCSKEKYVQHQSWTVVVGIHKLQNLKYSNNWHGGSDIKLWLWFDSPKQPNIFSLNATKLARKTNGRGQSRGYVQVTSADSCRMKGIEGVGTVELVFVGRLLLVPVWRMVRDVLTGKGKLDIWVVRAGT